MRLPAAYSASNLDAPSALTAASLARARSGMAGPVMPAPAPDPTASAAPSSWAARRGWPEVAACQLSRLSRTYWVIRSSICRAIRSASTNLGFDAATSPVSIATWPRNMSMVWR